MRRLLARQKELESPTFRLGGGRSIQLSYWRIYWSIVTEKGTAVNLFLVIANQYGSRCHCEERSDVAISK